MRCVAEPRRSLRLFRAALFATISAAAAGCSADTHRFDSNPFDSRQQASAQSQEVTGSVQHRRGSRVQSEPLPPPTASAPGTRPVAGGSSGGSPGMASYHPGQASPQANHQASYQASAKPSPEITGSASAHASAKPGWNWQGGTAITVQQGDTIDSIVRRYGVPASAIADANNLPNGSTLRPGQRLVIPKYEATGSTVAPRVAAAPPQPRPAISAPATTAPASSGPHVHIIQPGETLMKLSRQYNKPLVEIARANNIPPSTLVKIGDRIVIPGVRGQVAAARPVAQPKPAAPVMAQAQPKPAAPAPQKLASAPVTAVPASPPTAVNVVTPAANPEPPKVKQEVTAATPSFRWPVNGRVIQAFGPKPSGQQNDGINISVPEGTAIKAAEDGVVAYAGNELKTYGNLVLIRHSNGYVTAYAHASEITVKRDDVVKRGQVIAKAGQTGTVNAPQVHFEIRKGSTPVDPAPFLAKGG
jgi:murein DD-endopeptidase MepM/ murein hydrolase activator NlpD